MSHDQLFDHPTAPVGLQIVHHEVTSTGMMLLHYEPVGVAPTAKYEGVTFPIAEAATQLEAARLLCYRALWLADRGERHTKEAAMVKWWAPKIARETIHQCLLLHGHYGYTDELPFEQRLRDVIGLEIGDGSAEIMKIIVARELIGRESLPY